MEHDQSKPSYWAVLPAAVRYDPQLPASAKLLYAEISSLTDQKGYCYASNAYFIRLFELSERTIIRLLRTLAAAGYVTIEDDQGGRTVRKIYAGVNPAGAYPDKNVTPTPTKMSPPGDKNVTHTRKENKKEDQPPTAPQGAAGENRTTEIWDPAAFERFWALYPKKRDKIKAIREWNRLKADRKLMAKMSAALKTQIASEEWLRDKGQAIPYPGRWLSHRRWEDVLTVDAPAATSEEAVEWI